jgi:hypothetical protein
LLELVLPIPELDPEVLLPQTEDALLALKLDAMSTLSDVFAAAVVASVANVRVAVAT